MGDTERLQLLRPFNAVQALRVSERFSGRIALAPEDVTGAIVAGVLPALDLLCLEGQPVSSIEKFVVVRRDEAGTLTAL